MISDLTIKELQAAVMTEILKSEEGKEYTTRPVHPLIWDHPEPKPLKVATLTGFIDYVANHGKDNSEPKGILIHVASHAEVRFLSPLYGDNNQRNYFIIASFEDMFGKGFSFGVFYDHEHFVIALQSLFVDTPERAQILRLIGTIKEEAVHQTSDDGVTQSVTAKAGIALVKEVAVPNLVELRPWRTFREIEQPASKFVLRVRTKEGQKPECALFEADGGMWKLEAINGIKQFIGNQHFDLPVIA